MATLRAIRTLVYILVLAIHALADIVLHFEWASALFAHSWAIADVAVRESTRTVFARISVSVERFALADAHLVFIGDEVVGSVAVFAGEAIVALQAPGNAG